MSSVNSSFPVKSIHHNVTIVNYLNKLLTWRNNSIKKETNNSSFGFSILMIFMILMIGEGHFTKRKLSFLGLNELRASPGKRLQGQKCVKRLEDVHLVSWMLPLEHSTENQQSHARRELTNTSRAVGTEVGATSRKNKQTGCINFWMNDWTTQLSVLICEVCCHSIFGVITHVMLLCSGDVDGA